MSARVASMSRQDIEAVLCLDEVEEAGITVPASVVSRVEQNIICSTQDMQHHCFSRWERQQQRQAQRGAL